MGARILVTGATGQVGQTVVDVLRRRGHTVVAATRTPGGAGAALSGVRLVRFDYDDPSSFAPALRGIERVFLVVRPGDDEADGTAIPFLEDAARAGVRHCVLLSAMGIDRLPGTALRRIERWLETSAMAWTFLRPNFFFQIFTRDALGAGIREAAEIRVPAGDAALSFIDVRDIAEVAGEALASEAHAGRAYTLTGPAPVTHGEVAETIGRQTGRAVRYVAAGDEEAALALAAAGFPAARITRLLGFYRLVRAGACAPVSGDVEAVLGRSPIGLEEFVRDHLQVWVPIGTPFAVSSTVAPLLARVPDGSDDLRRCR
jgi:uncharacterized protein YbjT (DUF2867 family)